MARTVVPSQDITRDGLEAAYTAPVADGDTIEVGRTILHVKNADAAPVTVTVQSVVVVDGLDLEELAVPVPAGGEMEIGPFPPRTFARAVGSVPSADIGRAYVDYSSVVGITRAVKKLV